MRRHGSQVIVLLMVLLLGWLAAATVCERLWGSEVAHARFYRSWFFAALWALIAVAGITQCFIRHLYRRPAVFALHLALAVILAGAAITWLTGTTGKMWLATGEPSTTFELSDGTPARLPFAVTLTCFDTRYYAGTATPMAFEARVRFEGGDSATIALNRIATCRGYSFCLNGYDEDGRGVALKVTHDPLGVAVTHAGYLMLLCAIIACVCRSGARYRALIARLNARLAAALVALMALPAMAAEQPRTLPADVADDFGTLYVLHNGRVCPFETMAREVTTKLCGKPSWQGYNACQVVTGWWLYGDDWAAQPMIRLKRDGRSVYTSLNDLTEPTMMADDRYALATTLYRGTLFRVMPLRRGSDMKWYVPGSLDIPADIDEGRWAFMKNGMNYFNEMVVAGRHDDCRSFIAKLRRYQEREGGELLPSPWRMRAERLYNRIEAVKACAIVLLVLSAVAIWRKRRKLGAWMVGIALVAIFLYLTLLLALRWMAAGHLPLSNGYETMLVMGWGALLIALSLLRRVPLLAPMGILAAGFTLLVAALSGADPAITPLMPVLNSPWLCIHVVLVMMAYALFAVMTLTSAWALVRHHRADLVDTLHLVSRLMLYPAVMLLTLGIFVGAVWAGVSWGNYWTWDPKETWALITLLIYAMPLHEASLPRFGRPLFYHAYVVAAFLSVAVTYWGVNHLLGGMHSYA